MCQDDSWRIPPPRYALHMGSGGILLACLMHYDLSISKRKLVVRIAVIAILSSAFLFLLLPSVLAADSLADYTKDNLEELLAKTRDTSEFEEVKSILLGENSQFLDATIGENGLGTLIIKFVKVAAMCMVALFVLNDVLKETERGSVDFDFALRVMVKMTISVFCIFYVEDLAKGIQGFGAYLVEGISTKTREIEAMYKAEIADQGLAEIKDELVASGTWEALPNLIEIKGFANPIFYLLKLAIKTVSYSFFIELAIRKAFMPMAMVSIIDGGERSPGVRYLKKFFCVYIKMAIILIAMAAATVIVQTTHLVMDGGIKEGLVAYYDAWTVKGAALYFVKNGSELAEEIMGIR